MRAKEFIAERKKKKSSRSTGGYFFPGYGYYGTSDSGEGGGDGGGESANRGMAEGSKMLSLDDKIKIYSKHKSQAQQAENRGDYTTADKHKKQASRIYSNIVNLHFGDDGKDAQNAANEYIRKSQAVAENFADGRNPQDKGDAKRHGINTKASVSSLRKTAKQGGRKGQLAHWLANMKSGRAKAKKK